MKVSWKKEAGATGYQIRIATNKKMKNAQTVNVGPGSKSNNFKGLRTGVRYYVKVRPLKEHKGTTYKGIQCRARIVKVR